MPLAPGTRLGPYTISDLIGAGGMGEVYRATDTHLDRRVAIKVLPESFARDPDRLARFEREARTLAALNHPNIATVHGLERTDGVLALVMELVEGQTLADRLGGTPMAIDDVLPIARQLAEALEAAHESGIVHRDLKPANITLRSDGTVKVLDFGLAKPVSHALTSSGSVSMSPTITTPALTQAGVILGTAAYMSPEQARGGPVDRRTDIWAFGCVLFEMLSGRRPFDSESVSDTIASVLKSDPPWETLPRALPGSLRALVGRCLVKDPRQRMRDMGEVRLALDRPLDTVDAAAPAAQTKAGVWRRMTPWLAGAVVGAGLAGLVVWASRPEPPQVHRLNLLTESSAPLLISTSYTDLAIAPDGQTIVYSAEGDDRSLRRLSLVDGQTRPLVTGGEPFEPFFSADGQFVGYYDLPTQELRRVPIVGGAAETITRAGPQIRGATWGADDTIVYTHAVTNSLWRVPARGGQAEELTKPSPGEAHRYPTMLPDGRRVLFTIVRAGGVSQIALLSLETRTWETLVAVGAAPRFVAPGYLLYTADGGLLAAPFDVSTGRINGEATVVESAVAVKSTGAADYGVSSNGSLVTVTSAGLNRQSALGWVSRDGTMVGELLNRAGTRIFFPRLSPDGSRVVYQRGPVDGDLWTRDIERGTDTRITDEGIANLYPAWGPGPSSLTFTSNRTGSFAMFTQDVDAARPPALFEATPAARLAGNWSRDGRWLVFYELNPQTSRDIWMRSADRSAQPTPLIVTKFNERSPQISPDGQWLAYLSDQSGNDQVYVTPFPTGGRVIPVSTAGGREPVWSRDGRELFFRVGEEMWGVAVSGGTAFSVGKPRLLFKARFDLDPNQVGHANYDVSPDGQRFLMVRTAQSGSAPLTLVQNWTEQLRRLRPRD
jgi:serine/threonine-protein kinase